jgi:transposase-like protein
MEQSGQLAARSNGQVGTVKPDPEVVPKAERRRYSAAYKEQILRAAEACTGPGEIGALLRREGLYSSQLSKWRKQWAAGGQAGLAGKGRGRKAQPETRQQARIRELEAEVAGLRARLESAETIIAVQKKLATLLGPLVESQGDWNR